MSFDNETVLKLSVQEAVWFQKGQEVADVLSVQLTPDISINEEGEYVYVRGSLFLEGEYKPIIDEEDNYSLRDISPYRTVEDVVSREDGTNEFYHNFPVDITIPVHRVGDLNDIYITIESFDYELKDQSNLKLIADITIGGLQHENREENNHWAEVEEQETLPLVESVQTEEEQEEVMFEPFRLEVKRDPQLEEPEWENLSAFSSEQVVEPIEPVAEIPPIPVVPEPEPIRYQHIEEEQAIKWEAPVVNKEEEQAVKWEAPVVNREEEQAVKWEQPVVNREQESYSEVEDVVSVEAYDEQYHQEEVSRQDENALYLTKLFNKEEEEEFSQLRMYIVQPGDTIETIAGHYGVKLESVMRANSLEDTHVTVGKILYIPKGRKHHI